MKTLKFTAYLFYRYYSRGGTKDIAYFSTLCALALLIMLHFFQALLIFHGFSFLPFSRSDERVMTYLKSILISIPLFICLFFAVKKDDLKSAEYSDLKVRRGYYLLISYIVLSVAALFLIIIKFPQEL